MTCSFWSLTSRPVGGRGVINCVNQTKNVKNEPGRSKCTLHCNQLQIRGDLPWLGAHVVIPRTDCSVDIGWNCDRSKVGESDPSLGMMFRPAKSIRLLR